MQRWMGEDIEFVRPTNLNLNLIYFQCKRFELTREAPIIIIIVLENDFSPVRRPDTCCAWSCRPRSNIKEAAGMRQALEDVVSIRATGDPASCH